MTPQELWGSIRDQYGSYLGCSSDDDYVKPEKFNYSLGKLFPGYEFLVYASQKR